MIETFKNWHNAKITELEARNDLGALIGFALTLGIAGVVIAMTQKVVQDTGSTLAINSSARNATDQALIGGVNLATQMPVIGTVAGLAVVIGVLFALIQFKN